MALTQITRVTLFKIPKEDDRVEMAKCYQEMTANATKDGQRYILSAEAGPAYANDLSQGYTFVAKTVFKNREDHDYYHTECPAHKALKASVKEKGLVVQGVLTVFYTPVVNVYV